MPLRMPTSNPNLLAPYTDFLAAIDEMVAADPADPEVGGLAALAPRGEVPRGSGILTSPEAFYGQQKKEKRYGEVLPSVW